MKNSYKINSNDTVTIFLNAGLETLVDLVDLPLVNKVSGTWYVLKDRHTDYVATGTPQKQLHRVLMQPEQGLVVDHINHNGLDNRRSNLRVVTQQQNCANLLKRPGKTSKFKGVSFIKSLGKWRSKLVQNGKEHFIGYFSDEFSAALAYDTKAKELFGPFALLNFPEKTLCAVNA